MQFATMALSINDIITKVDDWVWGWVLIVLILAAGVWLTVRTGFVQVRHIGKALRFMVKNEDDGDGEVTSFGALCTALSATIGTGNLPRRTRSFVLDDCCRFLRHGYKIQRGISCY